MCHARLPQNHIRCIPTVLATVLIVLVGGSTARSALVTIGFDEVPSTPGIFTGPVTEKGFVYSSVGNAYGLFSSPYYGNPGPEMEATALLPDYYVDDAGVLQLVGLTPGQPFQFLGMDIAQREGNPSATHTIRVEGFFQGSLLGTEDFITPRSDQGSTNSPYITVTPIGPLSDTVIDRLLIHLPGKSNASESVYFYTRLDNIQLNVIPAPGALSLTLCGLFALTMKRRRGK